MKQLLTISSFFLTFILSGQSAQNVITSDIDNFWIAHDRIKSTTDSVQQYKYINEFLSTGTPGLNAMQQARRYDDKEYINAIKKYPKFWESVRANTYKAKEVAPEIEKGIILLKKLYPDLKPAKIYFTIGALRSNGTTINDMVLIGTELAMANENTTSSEFTNSLTHLPSFFKSNPADGIVFLNLHEYIHTQQKTTTGNNLLAQCIIEGAAEFTATLAMGQSPTTAVTFGRKNAKRVRDKFSEDMFNPIVFYNWLWGGTDNEFNTRDLGYYTGYAICEKYYSKASDKKAALKEIIELDYNDTDKLEQFVDKSGYFEKPVKHYKAVFESKRPIITSISYGNPQQKIKAGPVKITVTFSLPMNKNSRNFELGPLGENNLLKLKKAEFSTDGRSMSLEANTEAGKQYQLELGYQFRSMDNLPLKPYLIDFTTSAD